VKHRSPRSSSLRDDASLRGDEELLAAFVDGDQDAFGELVRRHEDRIFALAVRMTGNRTDALDATQEAFIQAFRRAKSFRRESAFATWLYRIAANCCHDQLRKKRRAPTPEENLPDPVGSHPDVGEQGALRVDVSAALAQLSSDYREAVVMHDLGALPYEEIARITNVSIGTVKSRISRGRRKLAELLEPPTGARTSKDVE
jgi:RNA polymerase sigma-70 factor, ECF subfamily